MSRRNDLTLKQFHDLPDTDPRKILLKKYHFGGTKVGDALLQMSLKEAEQLLESLRAIDAQKGTTAKAKITDKQWLKFLHLPPEAAQKKLWRCCDGSLGLDGSPDPTFAAVLIRIPKMSEKDAAEALLIVRALKDLAARRLRELPADSAIRRDRERNHTM